MRYRASSHRRDDNHKAIVAALRAAGWHVVDTSQAGDGCPDLFAVKGGRVIPIEVKDGAKPPSARRLSESEQRQHDAFRANGCPVVILETVEQAVTL